MLDFKILLGSGQAIRRLQKDTCLVLFASSQESGEKHVLIFCTAGRQQPMAEAPGLMTGGHQKKTKYLLGPGRMIRQLRKDTCLVLFARLVRRLGKSQILFFRHGCFRADFRAPAWRWRDKKNKVRITFGPAHNTNPLHQVSGSAGLESLYMGKE